MNIDFVTGTHGNYLEFILNKLLLGRALGQMLPFADNGSSHARNESYQNQQVVYCGHFFNLPTGYTSDKIISIQFDKTDLLPILSNAYRRSTRPELDDRQLHVDTFNKLIHTPYKDIIDALKKEYNYTIDQHQPHCPRHLLRHIHQWMFLYDSLDPWTTAQNQMHYSSNQTVFTFPFASFYNIDQFLATLENIKSFFALDFVELNIKGLHREFLKKQPWLNYKQVCDEIVDRVLNKQFVAVPTLTLFQECYINAQLESKLNVNIFMRQDEYFSNTKDLISYLENQI